MKKGWTTTKLITVGSLGVLNLVISLFGGGITIVTGIPGMSGAINGFIGAIITVFAVFLIPSFGVVTIMYTIYSILALPLPLMGTPGFFPKILLGFTVGLIVDICLLLSRKNKWLVIISASFVSQYATGLGIYLLGVYFGLPGIEKLRKFVFLPIPILILGGALLMGGFGYLGFLLYKKLENTALVKRIQGGK